MCEFMSRKLFPAVLVVSLVCFTCFICVAQDKAQYAYPFQNPSLPIETRINNILSLMTVEEKIDNLGTVPSVPRLGIKGAGHVEGLHGLALGGPGAWGKYKDAEGNEHDTPIPTTQFPQAVGLGETWDPAVIQQAAAIEGYEARYIFQSDQYQHVRGGLVIRAPNADLDRDIRWGRSEESYGEDAFFNGTMVTAFVKGLQGDHPRYWQTAALLKHFLANSNENGRGGSSSNFDERLMREYYSVPFRMGIVEGGARAYMAAYNAWNGIPMTVQPILKNMTFAEWGLDGIVCTDAGGLSNMVTQHKYYKTYDEAAAGAIHAGINQFLDRYKDPVADALKNHLLSEADLDENLKGVFRVMIRLGLLDPPEMVPYNAIKGKEDPWTTAKHKAAARLVTQESIVLLKNDLLKNVLLKNDPLKSGAPKSNERLLPLDKSKLKSIALIGPHIDEVLLDWYSGTPPYTVTPLEGIRNKVGPGVEIRTATSNAENAAVNAARTADVAIVIIGNHPTCGAGWNQCPTPSDGKEAIDRQSLILEQEELAKQVYAANPHTVVVLLSSFPFAIQWTRENIPAILHITHNSQEEGNALADVLFGDYNPAGRLVHTWPQSIDQLPPMMDYDIRHGRTYMYFKGKPLFPFGYGLSYTTFAYSRLHTSASVLRKGETLRVKVEVRNTGTRAGDEVVQMYVQHLGSTVERPLQELRGFKRIHLQPNEMKAVSLTLPASDLTYWNAADHKFLLEKEKIKIAVGSSSADLRSQQIIEVVR
jgi:beta-glucosidase